MAADMPRLGMPRQMAARPACYTVACRFKNARVMAPKQPIAPLGLVQLDLFNKHATDFHTERSQHLLCGSQRPATAGKLTV